MPLVLVLVLVLNIIIAVISNSRRFAPPLQTPAYCF